MRNPRSIVITGASSGIGAALAAAYAAGVHLALVGRDSQRLAETAATCRQAGDEVTDATIDVCDRSAMETWLTERDLGHPIELAVANAGISAGTAAGSPTRS